MLNDLSLTQLKTILDQAHTAIVLLGPAPTYDQVASATAFYLALKDLKSEVTFCAPNEVSFPDLLGQEEIKQKLGNKDLSISFDYSETAVDKVSYHIDEEAGKFYLVVKPQKGHKPLDPDSVSFDLIGAQADVIFLFGIHAYDVLEHLYEHHAEVYENATVVTVHSFEPEIGDLKLDVSGKSCWSEATLTLIEKLGLELTGEGASNLLMAIDQATDWLTSFTATADTFEAVATLLRAGGKRLRKPVVNTPVATAIGGFVPASEVIMERTTRTPFEAALEKARERKIQEGDQTDISLQELKNNSMSKEEKLLTGQTSSIKTKKKQKQHSSNSNQSGQLNPIKDKMRDKNYIPENLSGRRS